MLMIITIVIVLIISIMYMLNLSNLYVMKTGNIIKYGTLLSFRNLLKNLGVCAIAFIPVFAWEIINDITFMLIPILILFLFGFVYILLLFALLSMYAFDKYINTTQYPDYVRKGLSKDE